MGSINGILVVDKPSGPTSHDIVDIVRKAAGMKKVGHTGTLDPMATGVLVLLIGQATRIGRFLELEPKEYIAEALFGITTDTQDITGTAVKESTSRIDISKLKRVLPQFTGDILQIPPMVSAIKIGGKPLYKLARQGKEVERKERKVSVYALELLDFIQADSRDIAKLKVLCSGGTYVRTLVNDIGERLSVGATLKSLRRTRVGRYNLSNALSIDDIKTDNYKLNNSIIFIDDALSHIPAVFVKDTAVNFVLNGREIDFSLLESYPGDIREDDLVRIKHGEKEVLALGKVIKNDGIRIKPEVVLAQEA